MKYGDDRTTSLCDAMTRSMTFIVTLIERAISSDVAVTLAGESAYALALPQIEAEAPRVEIVADRAVAEDVDRRQRDRHHLLAFVDELVEAAAAAARDRGRWG